MPKDGLSIGQLAAAVGVHLETVRYYERIGLMVPPARSAGGHRIYDHAAVERLGFIRRARDLRFSLADTRALLSFSDIETGCCADVKRSASAHLNALDSRIADLRALRATLAAGLAQCDGNSDAACAMLDTLRERYPGGKANG